MRHFVFFCRVVLNTTNGNGGVAYCEHYRGNCTVFPSRQSIIDSVKETNQINDDRQVSIVGWQEFTRLGDYESYMGLPPPSDLCDE